MTTLRTLLLHGVLQVALLASCSPGTGSASGGTGPAGGGGDAGGTGAGGFVAGTGGVGASGMGHYHGFDGFETFSKKKGVFLQSRLSPMAFLRPPYGPRKRALIGWERARAELHPELA